jgi:uncharacterized protein
MQTNILWTGREYYSLENCLISSSDSGVEINSVIVGKYNQTIYRVEYIIRTNQDWETVFFEVISRQNNISQYFKFEGDGKGNWFANGNPFEQFAGCIDIDIPLTPFTNSLPINRLKLRDGDEKEIKVIYIDILEKQAKPVRQKYLRLSETEYHYENIPNDFEAQITVDQFGFVLDYPSLFVRTEALSW